MIQINIVHANNQGAMNELLRLYQLQYPQRKIIGISCAPAEPAGWYATITYEVKI